MSCFDTFRANLAERLATLARDAGPGLADTARRDAVAFVDDLETDLYRWTRLLASGELLPQDFRDLVRARKAQAEIPGLREAGVEPVRIQRFRTRLVSIIIETAFDVFA